MGTLNPSLNGTGHSTYSADAVSGGRQRLRDVATPSPCDRSMVYVWFAWWGSGGAKVLRCCAPDRDARGRVFAPPPWAALFALARHTTRILRPGRRRGVGADWADVESNLRHSFFYS